MWDFMQNKRQKLQYFLAFQDTSAEEMKPIIQDLVEQKVFFVEKRFYHSMFRMDLRYLKKTFYKLSQKDDHELSGSIHSFLLDHYTLIHGAISSLTKQFGVWQRGHLFMFRGEKLVLRTRFLIDEYLKNSCCNLRRKSFLEFLREYQSKRPLGFHEILQIKPVMEYALLQNMVAALRYTCQVEDALQKAVTWLKHMPQAQLDTLQDIDHIQGIPAKEMAAYLLWRYGSKPSKIQLWKQSREEMPQGARETQLAQKAREFIASYHKAQKVLTGAVESLEVCKGLMGKEAAFGLSQVYQVLCEDEVFTRQTRQSQLNDLMQVSRLSLKTHVAEKTIVRHARKLAEDNGSFLSYYLYGPGQEKLLNVLGKNARGDTASAKGYFSLLYLFTVTASLLFATFGIEGSGHIWLFLLGLIPSFFMVKTLLDTVYQKYYPSRLVPKLKVEKRLPQEQRTMVVIPILLDHESAIHQAVEKLKVYDCANPLEGMYFTILADLKESQREWENEDQPLIELFQSEIQKCNLGLKAPKFFGAVRKRVYLEREKKFAPEERKRGALMDLSGLLRNKVSAETFLWVSPDLQKDVKYIITLDSDTQLLYGTAAQMIGAMAHPLNRPQVDRERKTVVDGYGVLGVNIDVGIQEAGATGFSRLLCQNPGIHSYHFAQSDVYQDVFGRGSFTGKGIFDIDVYLEVLEGRFPKNRILSHDLLEGCVLGAGKLEDVTLLDGVPHTLKSYLSREHRWIRGDIQLLPYLLPRVANEQGKREKNPVGKLGRFKILENILRCFYPPVCLLCLIIGCLLANRTGVGFLLLGLSYNFFGPLIHLVRLIASAIGNGLFGFDFWGNGISLLKGWKNAATHFLFLPGIGVNCLDGIFTACYRLFHSKKNLLQWTTAAAAERQDKGGEPRSYLPSMIPCHVVGVSLLFCPSFPITALVGAAFLCGPWMAVELSRKLGKAAPEISEKDKRFLHLLAAKTYRFFQEQVVADSGIGPDNVQIAPKRPASHKTSPTNIGYSLAAWIIGVLLGYEPLCFGLDRLEQVAGSMKRAQKWQGNLFNWYELPSMEPLKPHFISAVDCGNLACYLLMGQRALEHFAQKPLFGREMIQGFLDTAMLCREQVKYPQLEEVQCLAQKFLSSSSFGAKEAVEFLQSVSFLGKMGNAPGMEPLCRLYQKYCIYLDKMPFLRHIDSLLLGDGEPDQEFFLYCNTISLEEFLSEYPSIQKILQTRENRAGATLLQKPDETQDSIAMEDLMPMLRRTHQSLMDLNAQMAQLKEEFVREYQQMDFTPFYDKKRDLMHIGYDVEREKLSEYYYDLLCSESRHASLVGIMKHQLPLEHWFALGRPQVVIHKTPTLLSWTGTMFEYLMPALLMKSYPGSLLDQTYEGMLTAQRIYGHLRNMPFGVSESQYFGFDGQLNYQYQAFGAPQVALKPGMQKNSVIAPYATGLSLMVAPERAIANLKALKSVEAMGKYGFFEAVDLTKERIGKKPFRVVKSYMTHHQGMMLCGLCNQLHENILVELFHQNSCVEAVEFLLTEKKRQKRGQTFADKLLPGMLGRESERWEYSPKVSCGLPQLHIMGRGRLHMAVDQYGVSSIEWENRALTMTCWTDLLPREGDMLWIRGMESQETHLFGVHDGSVQMDGVYYSPNRAVYVQRGESLKVRYEIGIAGEKEAVVKRVVIQNMTDQSQQVEVVSALRPIMVPARDFTSHPAFHELMCTTSIDEQSSTIWVKKRPAHQGEQAFYLGIKLLGETEFLEMETSRLTLFQQADSILQADQFCWKGGQDDVLSPCGAFHMRVSIPPKQRVKLAFVMAAGSRQQVEQAFAAIQTPGQAKKEMRSAGWSAQISALEPDIHLRDMRGADELASCLITHCLGRQCPWKKRGEKNTWPRQKLWEQGISGDVPLLLLWVKAEIDLVNLERMEKWIRYLKEKGLALEVAVIVEGAKEAVERAKALLPQAKHFVGQEMEEPLAALLSAVAALSLGGEYAWELPKGRKCKLGTDQRAKTLLTPKSAGQGKNDKNTALVFDSGWGGFTPDGKGYVVRPNGYLPGPWSYVMGNGKIGTVVSLSGFSYTFLENARMQRITPYAPQGGVLETPSEMIFLDTEQGRKVVYGGNIPRQGGTCQLQNGVMTIAYEGEIACQLHVWVPLEDPVKLFWLSLQNTSQRPQKFGLSFLTGFVMGEGNETEKMNVHSRWEEGALLFENSLNEKSRTGFMAMDLPAGEKDGSDVPEEIFYTTDYLTCIQQMGQGKLAMPWQNHSPGNGGNFMGMLQKTWALKPGEGTSVFLCLGAEKNSDEAIALLHRYRQQNSQEPEVCPKCINHLQQTVERQNGVLSIQTPNKALDILFNHWLLYQVRVSRWLTKTGYFQSGGAIGFRDQLQDMLALIYSDPQLVRSHILDCAAHQFVEGDVLHWWHQPAKGVRTAIRDDLLFLPYVTLEYLRITADWSILQEQVPYLISQEIPQGQQDLYASFDVGEMTETLQQHIQRALHRSWNLGELGLPKMGRGDWNDGMDQVGAKGQGQSVWLGFFLVHIAKRWSRLLEYKGEMAQSVKYRNMAEKLKETLNQMAWDGEWYLRAFFDDGSPLGSEKNQECQIDLISQAWSVISGVAGKDRRKKAMDSAISKLLDRDSGVFSLLTPPFDGRGNDPGYIRGYIPGVRENGGQYTHGAIWGLAALCLLGEKDKAYEVMNLLNPIVRTQRYLLAQKYAGEPYCMAADVYASAHHRGRAGWTWYTGSGAWMYKVVLEYVLGFWKEGDLLSILPCLPAEAFPYTIDYRHGKALYHIEVDLWEEPLDPSIEDGGKGGIKQMIWVDGNRVREIRLKDDGLSHRVQVVISREG